MGQFVETVDSPDFQDFTLSGAVLEGGVGLSIYPWRGLTVGAGLYGGALVFPDSSTSAYVQGSLHVGWTFRLRP